MKISKELEISIAHILPGIGKCCNLHGHTMKVIVDIWGELNDNGMVLNFSDIKELIMEYDHKFLVPLRCGMEDSEEGFYRIKFNDGDKLLCDMKIRKESVKFVDIIGNLVTCENIADSIAYDIHEECENLTRIRVEVWETKTSSAECILEITSEGVEIIDGNE